MYRIDLASNMLVLARCWCERSNVRRGHLEQMQHEGLPGIENPLNIPDPAPLPSRCDQVPYVLVGDDAFGMTDYLMKLFPKTQLGNEENRIYNYR